MIEHEKEEKKADNLMQLRTRATENELA